MARWQRVAGAILLGAVAIPAFGAEPDAYDLGWDPGARSRVDPATVTVEPGDCLWKLAARSLPSNASNAEIWAATLEWYRVNADVIGADPNLIYPGQTLVAPSPDTNPIPNPGPKGVRDVHLDPQPR